MFELAPETNAFSQTLKNTFVVAVYPTRRVQLIPTTAF